MCAQQIWIAEVFSKPHVSLKFEPNESIIAATT